jgi:hypothetical protein
MLNTLCQKLLIAPNAGKQFLQPYFLDLVKSIITDYKPKTNIYMVLSKEF